MLLRPEVVAKMGPDEHAHAERALMCAACRADDGTPCLLELASWWWKLPDARVELLATLVSPEERMERAQAAYAGETACRMRYLEKEAT